VSELGDQKQHGEPAKNIQRQKAFLLDGIVHVFAAKLEAIRFGGNIPLKNKTHAGSHGPFLWEEVRLPGLTVHAAEIRVKEIGIRKVLGASVSNITLLMSKEFILWVLIANVVAWPLAYFAMNKWLENFAFRTHINIGTFVITASLSLLFAVITVSYQTLKTAFGDPVNSLRYE
jgi:hypothetical protein